MTHIFPCMSRSKIFPCKERMSEAGSCVCRKPPQEEDELLKQALLGADIEAPAKKKKKPWYSHLITAVDSAASVWYFLLCCSQETATSRAGS